MDTLPLPPRPNLTQYRKRAKDLVAAVRAGKESAVRDWAASWLSALSRLLEVPITPFVQHSMERALQAIELQVRDKVTAAQSVGGEIGLADAQYLIARAHSFENWAAFARHIDQDFTADPEGRAFEAAADAIVTGDLAALQSLIREQPELIRARSPRVHRVTLLHYIAANGVEGFRQKTPPNAVDIARFLLQCGAEPDALSDIYAGGDNSTTMVALVSSTHPAEAGLQPQLVDVLVDHGAAPDGVADDGAPLMTALAFDYIEAARALERRGARIDSVVAAAALGRLEVIRGLIVDHQTLKPGVPLVAPWWQRSIARNAKAHLELALAWACKFGQAGVANFLLDLGVDPVSRDSDDMTALHWAAASGLGNVVSRLIASGAPLELENTWGGTVLNSTLHFALYMPRSGVDYPALVQALIEAGADVTVVDPEPSGNAAIDAVLARARSRPGERVM